MSGPRKRWKVVDNFTDRHMESRAAAYRYIENAITNYGAGYRRRDLRFIHVHVDERDGQGWRLYERVDLASVYRHGSI